MTDFRKGRVAVVGTGIAGLACAHILAKEYAVSIFESQPALGMDSASISHAGGRMDVPLRTFSTDYYPNLSRLYEDIGVSFSTANYQFSLSNFASKEMYFTYYNFYRNDLFKRVFGFDLVSVPMLTSWHPTKVIKYIKLLGEMYWFQKRGPRDLQNGGCVNKTFKQYVLESHSTEFYYELLMPMLSVVCTCTWDAVGQYPAEVLVDYMTGRSRQHPMGSTTMRATDGTVEIVRKLSLQCEQIHTSCYVQRVVPGSKPIVMWCTKADGEQIQEFDHVIIATQANAASALLSDQVDNPVANDLHEILTKVKYEKNRTVLHQCPDAKLWGEDFPGTCHLQVDLENNRSDCTIWMNRIDPLLANELKENVFQTWNPFTTCEENKILDVVFERPVLTLDSMRDLDHLNSKQGQGGLWFVGAYSLYSMPLLENGVRSAIRVANKLLDKSNQYPELGAQLSGAAFADRRPDLVTSKQQLATRKRSYARLALDGMVWGSALLLVGGSMLAFAGPGKQWRERQLL
ncbi:hypothetical protein BASA81_005579 [Batrachochytrium salamandrivorans]|nr:hypothetical protein BASA81_005579 [Batrachochytrium salamandrivorans]